MRMIVITLLAVLMLAVFACAGGIVESDNSGNISGYENTSGKLFIETLNPEAQCFSLINSVESKINQVQNWNSKFTPSARGGYRNMPQNFQPTFNRGRPEQLPPAFEREGPLEKDIPKRELKNILEEQTWRQKNKSYYQSYNKSYYQSYVTPDADAVTSYLEENDLGDKYEIYEAALSWTWISDQTLNCVEEKWLTPSEFLKETPNYSSNPDSGEPVSDCEEQANTLASLLIASEEYNESTVRVAVGKVDFGNVSGGHAWVEVYEDGGWFPLDPTDGPYYDDDSCELVSADTSEIDYDRYLSSAYPAVEVWYYYNNEYFVDTGKQIGDAPVYWYKKSESYQ